MINSPYVQSIQVSPPVNVAKRWHRQYFVDGHWQSGLVRGDAQDIYEQILALPSDASAEQIDSVIGNNSWTTGTCSDRECTSSARVRILEDLESDGSSIGLCVFHAKAVLSELATVVKEIEAGR